jgi:hypothetical protein
MVNLKSVKQNLKGETEDFIKQYRIFLTHYKSFANGKKSEDPLEEDDKSSNVTLFQTLFNELSNNKDVKSVHDEEEGYSIVNLYRDIYELIKILKNKDIVRVEYSLISKIVLDVKDTEDSDKLTISSDFFDNFIVAVKGQLLKFIENCESDGRIEEYQNYILCFYKVLEHTSLANMQFNELYVKSKDQISSLNSSLEKTNQKIDVRKKDIGRLSKETRELSKKYSNMNVEIISVLGVFSAFVFVMFGGFDSLAKILEGLQNNDLSILKILIISSILICFLITVLYSLMYWVSIIIEKPILHKNCKCNVCWNFKHIYARHRFYLTVMIVCAIVFLASNLLIVLNPILSYIFIKVESLYRNFQL